MPVFLSNAHQNLEVLFVHIPKTGGSYITNQFKTKYVNTLISFPNLHRINQHYTLQEIISNVEIDFENLYSFSLVRNPISKVISTYYFFKNCPVLFPSMDLYIDFVEDVVRKRLYLDHQLVMKYFLNNRIDINHFRPQVEYLSPLGLVDWFKVETDIEDFKNTIRMDFGVDVSRLSFSKTHLDRIDQECKQRLAHIYREDIEYFKY